eukprot:CAMPEP_0119002730 /NCGR_PEP_ID=MMETSP1176-20130426/71_1 /TAXON_ID=265551 /ORGANISM="Synedropsis recta cf, Strain CCMP1620" /LENGTH=186 /DNA_ID=CAMNT_0006954239 /DNA_START=40 /DNA_END=600 /DNA_ORIENTATION=+
MKFSTIVCALAITSATAFAPNTGMRASTTLNAVDRRAMFGQIAAAAVVVALPGMASADGAVSTATITKSKVLYGSRIADLKSAVAAGDFDAVADEKNAFILFNSGAYPQAKTKANKKAAIEGTNAIFAAIRSKDKAALKSAYENYVSTNNIRELPTVTADGPTPGQGYATDYSYLYRTKAAAIYVR